MRWLAPAALLGVLVAVATQKGGPMKPTDAKVPPRIERSLDKLVPSFRRKVEELLALMKRDGFHPLVWETYRTPERAAELAKEGTGKALSQHSLGLAVDIVDKDLRWNASREFWDALHNHALALGLGRIKRRDKKGNLDWDWPHVQALPGSYDGRLRLLSEVAREQFLQTRYA